VIRAPVKIAVLDTDPRSGELAQRLRLPLVSGTSAGAHELVLKWEGDVLGLHDLRAPRARPVFVEVAWLRPLPRRGPLAQAVGRRTRTVVDATAGLGGDALRLAAMGLRVTAIERTPVIAALLENGFERLRPRLNPRIVPLPELRVGDAVPYLKTLREPPDCVFLDPMFPPRRRDSALPAREMRLLRELGGDDEDAGELFAAAQACRAGRVVVKRPDHAGPLMPEPDHNFSGKLVRYDVYLRRPTRGQTLPVRDAVGDKRL
jgi:16S rRNA (guanine1516-N2)-methyltransferase